MDDLRLTTWVIPIKRQLANPHSRAGSEGNRLLMGRRVLLALLSAAVLVGLVAQPGAAVNVPQAVVVSSNPAEWTPHVLDGKVATIVQVGNKMVAGGQFTQVASAAAPTTAIARSNIFAFDAATGAIDTAFAPVLDAQVESLAVAPDGLHVFAGGSFTKINGVAQKSLVKLRLSDGARITAFKGKTNARVKDMAVSGGRLYIGGTFKTVNAVTRAAFAAVDPVTGALSNDVNLAFAGPRTGTVNIDKFDISPDGSQLIAIGNWTTVAGLQRDQIVMLNLATTRCRSAAGRPPATSSSAAGCSPPTCATSTPRRTAAISWSGPPAATGRAACATPPPAGSWAPPPPGSSRPGSTTPAATPCTAWLSPGPRSTSAATSAG